MKTQPLLTGIAGEYYVAAELSRRGHIASVTLRNTRGMDILATNQEGSRSITIQCKTTRRTDKGWLLSKESEKFSSPRHFYVFVELREESELPAYHIVPSRVVAKRIREGHRNWLRTKGRNGIKHKDSNMRQFWDSEDEFLNKWGLLRL